MTVPLRLPADRGIPASWSTAGIADARAFTINDRETVHSPAWFTPNRVTARCGATGYTVDHEGRTATWADSEITCPTCTTR